MNGVIDRHSLALTDLDSLNNQLYRMVWSGGHVFWQIVTLVLCDSDMEMISLSLFLPCCTYNLKVGMLPLKGGASWLTRMKTLQALSIGRIRHFALIAGECSVCYIVISERWKKLFLNEISLQDCV